MQWAVSLESKAGEINAAHGGIVFQGIRSKSACY